MSHAGAAVPPGWHPDPTRRHQVRFWDGTAWSDHVSNGGVQSIDPVAGNLADRIDAGLTVFSEPDAGRIQEMVTSNDGHRGAGITQPVAAGDGTLWGEPILIVSQKAKLLEVTNQYSVFNQAGQQVAYVNQIGQSAARKALRVLTSIDQFLTHRLEICSLDGTCQLRLTRPAKFVKSTVIVEHPAGGEIGRIVQANVFGKIRFSLEADGQELGSINAENWRAWDFNIQDRTGTEVARITKTWEGLAKTMFTTADNYVVQLHRPLENPLLSLVVASALSVDTALKQDQRGFN
jgi:uncharacterized protein YxjI